MAGGAAIDASTNDGGQPIHSACQAGQLEVAQWLVAQGVAVDVSDHYGGQPLHWLVVGSSLAAGLDISRQLKLAQWLVAQGAAVDATDDDGQQPLHICSAGGSFRVLQWLVAQGAAVDAIDNQNWQPLHHACEGGQLEAVQWLVSKGAIQCTHVLREGVRGPLSLAQVKGHHNVAEFLERELVKIDRLSRRRSTKQQVKPTLSLEEAERAEKARQQAERELLAMCEGTESVSQSKKKKPKKKKSGADAEVGAAAGAAANRKATEVQQVETKELQPVLAEAGHSKAVPDTNRDSANSLLRQTIHDISNVQPSEQCLAHLEDSLAQATSASQQLIANATQLRKTIKLKLKKLRNKAKKVAPVLEALHAAMGSSVVELADAISQAESSIHSNDALVDAPVFANARLEDALTRQRVARTEATLDTAERASGALALSQPAAANQTAEQQQQSCDDSSLCVVCINKPKDVLLLPCRHMCVCLECCESILQADPLCPLCRIKIESHLQIFV